MKPEASFDILFTLDRIKIAFPEVHMVELSSVIYLGYLLSVYDGITSDRWGYQFSQHKWGGPYGEDLAKTMEELTKAGYVNESDGRVSITEASAIILNTIKTLVNLQWRTKYLFAATDSVLSRTLPMALNAIQKEPMLSQMSSSNWRSLLGTGPSLDSLYEEVSALHQVLGENANDIWMASLTWLDYWKAIGDSEVEITESTI